MSTSFQGNGPLPLFAKEIDNGWIDTSRIERDARDMQASEMALFLKRWISRLFHLPSSLTGGSHPTALPST